MRRKLLMGATIYGRRHLDFFFRYCLPSLNSPGNLPELMKHRDIGIIIHTDKEGAAWFKNLDFAVVCDVTEGDKYEMIGMHEHQDLEMAMHLGADYHLLMPDFIYSENCFRGVLNAIAQGHKAITRLVVSTTQETILPELDRSRSAVDLATLSLKHIHPGIKHWLVPESGFPPNHVLAWVNQGNLHMCSPHQTPVYIANEAIQRDYSTKPLDCVLDKIINGPVYCPKPEDEIVIIEVSPEDSRKPLNNAVDLSEFCRIIKVDTGNSARQIDIFEQETVDRISGEWNDVDFSEQKSNIIKVLREGL